MLPLEPFNFHITDKPLICNLSVPHTYSNKLSNFYVCNLVKTRKSDVPATLLDVTVNSLSTVGTFRQITSYSVYLCRRRPFVHNTFLVEKKKKCIPFVFFFF